MCAWVLLVWGFCTLFNLYFYLFIFWFSFFSFNCEIYPETFFSFNCEIYTDMSWCLFFNSLSSPFPSISWYLGFNGSRDHCLYPQRWAGRLGHRAAGKGSRSERGGLCLLVPRCPPPSTLTTTPSPPPPGLVKKCTLGGEVFVHGHGWWDSPHDLRTTRPCFSLPPLRTPPHLGRQTSAPRTGLLPLRASPQPPPPKPGFPETQVPCQGRRGPPITPFPGNARKATAPIAEQAGRGPHLTGGTRARGPGTSQPAAQQVRGRARKEARAVSASPSLCRVPSGPHVPHRIDPPEPPQ